MHRLRLATKDDSPRLWELRTLAIQDISENFYVRKDTARWAEKPEFEGFKQIIAENYYLVVEEDAQLLGGGFLDLSQHSIEAMFVSPSAQGRGIGKLILTNLIEKSRELGIKELKLSATLNAERFYLANGFRKLHSSQYRVDSSLSLDCIEMFLADSV